VDARRPAPPGAAPPWRRFQAAGGLGALLLAVAFYLGAVAMDVWPTRPLGYRTGQYIPSDLYARVPFNVLSADKLAEARDRARNTTPATFKLNRPLIDEIVTTLRGLPTRLKATTRPVDLETEKPLDERFGIDARSLPAWRRYIEPDKARAYRQSVDRLAEELAQRCIVVYKDFDEHHQRSGLILVDGPRRTRKDFVDLIALKNERRLKYELDEIVAVMDAAIRPGVRKYLRGLLAEDRPTYLYDAMATQVDLDRAVEAVVANPPKDHYEGGTLLVRASRRMTPEGPESIGLSAEQRRLLRAEHRAYWNHVRRSRPWLVWAQVGGRALTLLLITAALVVYIARYQARIVRSRWRSFTLAAVALVALGLTKAVGYAPQLNPHTSVLAVLLAAMVLTIAYDQRFALAAGTILAIFVVLQLRAGLGLLVVLFVAAAVAIAQLREIRTRSKLIRVSGVTAALVAVAICAHGLAAAAPWKFILLDCMWGAGFALLAGLLIQGTLPLVERIFRVATSMTLLEWCDASKPLLKRLAMEAPGTYNHSLQLGSMCETAAEAIGARGLLARVGAYYHDIGKINKPSYFVENQGPGDSKHDKLSPAMSLLVIIGHVKDGLEMARQYSLPAVLHEFITTHHGTTMMQSFYNAAAEKRRAESAREPDEAEFRYPGPKPQSKEAAILMLADAAESSVRAITEPTPGRIENQVHTMVSRRLMDGQLDKCELTLSEVHQIEESLIRSLCGIYHARIAYPTPAGKEPAAADAPADNGQDARAKAKADATAP